MLLGYGNFLAGKFEIYCLGGDSISVGIYFLSMLASIIISQLRGPALYKYSASVFFPKRTEKIPLKRPA